MAHLRRTSGIPVILAAAAFGILGLALLLQSSAATTPAAVTTTGNKLYVNGELFQIRGVNYHPIATGTDQLDTSAPSDDIPKIKALNANTIGTYMMGGAEYETYSDLVAGQTFYDNLMPAAEENGLYVVVGYYSNQTIDWTDAVRVAKATSQYQALVSQAKDSPSTLMYLIGNEVFEKMADDSQRKAYAEWIGDMADWTHANDPLHPVTYADSGGTPALAWLKESAPNLDIYSINNYSFTDTASLQSVISNLSAGWTDKPVLLHEWGADSWNIATGAEDTAMQAAQVSSLARAVDAVAANTSSALVGGINFEYSDAWDFVGSASAQEATGGWACASCGDTIANEDYWGLATATAAGQSATRQTKPAYTSLQAAWAATPATPPTVPPTPPTPPNPNPTPLPGDVNNDATVNLTDLSMLLSVWQSADEAADINADGIVNLVDLSMLLSNWQKSS